MKQENLVLKQQESLYGAIQKNENIWLEIKGELSNFSYDVVCIPFYFLGSLCQLGHYVFSECFVWKTLRWIRY